MITLYNLQVTHPKNRLNNRLCWYCLCKRNKNLKYRNISLLAISIQALREQSEVR